MQAAADDGDEGEREEKEVEKEELGVPHIVMDASEPENNMYNRVMDTGRLPSTEEVR